MLSHAEAMCVSRPDPCDQGICLHAPPSAPWSPDQICPATRDSLHIMLDPGLLPCASLAVPSLRP